ncbi:MAG: RDD family protein [Pyrinomonadaceae bacterium]
MSTPFIETEEALIIETPERVQIAFSLASIGNRFLAVAIDHAIQFGSMFFAAWFFYWLASGPSDNSVTVERWLVDAPKWTIAVMIIVLFLLFTGYFIFFEWLWNGQTPGKRLMKLRVIRDDGRPITLWEAVARNLLRIFDAAPGFFLPVYSVGLIVVFISGRDQRVGDHFAGTVVIRERTDEAPTFDETFADTIGDSAFRRLHPRFDGVVDVSRLTDEEMRVVEAFLRRRWDLKDRQRSWMAWRVALPLMYKLKPSYRIESFSYEGFLEELLYRRHARDRFIN